MAIDPEHVKRITAPILEARRMFKEDRSDTDMGKAIYNGIEFIVSMLEDRDAEYLDYEDEGVEEHG